MGSGSCSTKQNTILWDIEGEILNKKMLLEGHLNTVWAVSFSIDGSLLFSGSADKTIRGWNVKAPDTPQIIFNGHTHWIRSLDVTPDGK